MRRVALPALLGLCLCLPAPLWAQSPSKSAPSLETAGVDAVLGRRGAWIQGLYATFIPRPDLGVTLDGVRLSTTHVVSFTTFSGTAENADLMGEVCALPGEVTPVMAALRAGGIRITGVHNHFLGESPRLVFVHFMAHGRAAELARTYRNALRATSTPLSAPPPPAAGSEPAWSRAVRAALGRAGSWSQADGSLEVDVLSADAPAGLMDFWTESALLFQQAPGGKVAATGDVTVTPGEVDRVISTLLQHGFQIEAVHNHMVDQRPQLFFVHFWKIGAPEELARGLNATLAMVRTRKA